jgi:hypothetical protein
MRALLHVVSIILLSPSLVFAIAFVWISHATAQKSLIDFFLQLLEDTSILMTWGLLVFVISLVLIAGAGFSARFRWLAGLVVALLAIISAVLLVSLGSSPVTSSNVLFFVPGFLSLCIGAWLAFTEWPHITHAANAANLSR